ncbi:uncharacterized protein [Drosophila bipectinata]|uniref:uncharacterized protein n=1 Tax=Drosophila bipectinata TaxID=42026 RepID=UPI0038B3D18C
MLDNRMSYGAHVEYSTIKAARIQEALSRMLPNVGGPKTISEEAALVLAGMILIDILANEAEEIYASNWQRGRNSSREAIRRSARQSALSSWQRKMNAQANPKHPGVDRKK